MFSGDCVNTLRFRFVEEEDLLEDVVLCPGYLTAMEKNYLNFNNYISTAILCQFLGCQFHSTCGYGVLVHLSTQRSHKTVLPAMYNWLL